MKTGTREFVGLVTGGQLPSTVSRPLSELLRFLDGKKVVITVGEYKKRRSTNQNSYMWGVVVKMITQAFRDAGNMVDDDDVYGFLKAEVWKMTQVMVTPDGEVLRAPGSTRKLNTMEMEVKLEQARAWAAEVLGISIPLPNETIKGET